MNNLSILNDDSLLNAIKTLAAHEREVTLEVLHHLREVERRQLFARLGYRSLFEYAVKELLYSEGAAQRRISSMRLLRSLRDNRENSLLNVGSASLPSTVSSTPLYDGSSSLLARRANADTIEGKIEAGTLPLSTLSQAQSFFRQEKISEPQRKMELLEKLEGKSSREVEKILVLESTHPKAHYSEKLRPIAANLHQLSIPVDDALLQKLEELKAILCHQSRGMSLKDLFEFAVDESLRTRRAKAARTQIATPSSPPTPAVAEVANSTRAVPPSVPVSTRAVPPTTQANTTSRYIPAHVKRHVWRRDEGRCSYVDQASGRRCSAKNHLEFDHIKAFAHGGAPSPQNLRLLCATHNRMAAVDVFGNERMRPFVEAIRCG